MTDGALRMRAGQVAVYLLAVLLALTLLVLAGVDAFLAVRAKNHATAAGDAAALAVARVQGRLLNEIGADNVAHLKAALAGDAAACAEIMARQRRACFLGPLAGLTEGNAAARRAVAGVSGAAAEAFKGDDMRAVLRRHVMDIRQVFAMDTQLFPEPWEGAWEEYARELEVRLSEEMVAGPDNAEFANLESAFPLACQAFYQAVAGRMWCWFKFNGTWLFARDSSTMPHWTANAEATRANSEIYSLHLAFRPLGALDDEWRRIIRLLTDEDIDLDRPPPLLTDPGQLFAFYDGTWSAWSAFEGICFNPDAFPIVGSVRPEYDVLGCAAVCRVERGLAALDAGDQTVRWTAAAKPFGTVENLDGETSVVTALRDFVTEGAFSQVRLVPVDAVGGRDLHSADRAWFEHLHDHLSGYFARGPTALNGCWYCRQLAQWEHPSFRQSGQAWLKVHGSLCVRPAGGRAGSGGTSHAH